MRILAMSDLHLSKKPWQVRKALRMGSNADLVLLAGDLVNDGTRSSGRVCTPASRRFCRIRRFWLSPETMTIPAPPVQ